MKSWIASPWTVCWLIAFGSGVASGFQEAAAPTGAATERERDTYRIYSLLLRNPQTSHGADDNARYLIAATARVERWQPVPCVAPPKSREAEFREVLADFESRKMGDRKLQRRFSTSKPYELLSGADVAAFQRQRGLQSSGREESQARFRGVTDVFTFDDVYFSKDGRLALTAMSTWCGGLCGKHAWRVFEKTSATEEWQEQPWVTCMTMAKAPAKSPAP
ncbi:MAG: hypothetical protein HYX27_05745 [Acidobacteria bacterium]|nr:hypothetical protein [Acidobacteriota bacterium]